MLRMFLVLMLMTVGYPLQIVDDPAASLPTWSPDGTKLAARHEGIRIFDADISAP